MNKQIKLGADLDPFNVQVLAGLRRVHFVAVGDYALTLDQAKQVQGACGYAPAGYGNPMALASAPSFSSSAAPGSIETRWSCFASCD